MSSLVPRTREQRIAPKEWIDFTTTHTQSHIEPSIDWRSELSGELSLRSASLEDVKLCIHPNKSAVAFINRLLDELLADIFGIVASGHATSAHASCTPAHSQPSFDSQLISRHWLRVATAFPSIWSHPKLLLGRSAFHAAISKAKASPLHLSWNEDDCANYAHFSLNIAAHVLSRTKTISLRGGPQHIAEILARFVHPVPILSELYVENTRKLRSYDRVWPKEFFLETLPRLSVLALMDVAIPPWTSCPFSYSLKAVEVSCYTRGTWTHRFSPDHLKQASYPSLLDALKRMPYVERLVLKNCISCASGIQDTKTAQFERTAELPCLRTLILEDTASSCAIFLAHVYAPHECAMRVRVLWSFDQEFADHVKAVTHVSPRDIPAVSLDVSLHSSPGLLGSRTDTIFALRGAHRSTFFELVLSDISPEASVQQRVLCAVCSALPLWRFRNLRISQLPFLNAGMWLSLFGSARNLQAITFIGAQVSHVPWLLRSRAFTPHSRLCVVKFIGFRSIDSVLALRRVQMARLRTGELIVLGERAKGTKRAPRGFRSLIVNFPRERRT